ncbi:MAG: NADH-quinone oxidoreductase subunit NuoK [Syntrophobacteraceae bacterium]|jgi:NADH-quinone oxidoreductase subunit K|nr:NADH-quinone oxidoreductase subunit NuoK [Syntrophobacteraceae bacterium]
MIVPFSHVLLLAATLFGLGMFCALARRNLIMIVLGVEIALNAASIAFVGSALHWKSMEGQAMVLFILAVAATEVSVGLAVIVYAFRRSGSFDPNTYNLLK